MENQSERVVPDTSVVVEGLLSGKIRQGEMQPKEIVIHEAVLAELELQANADKAAGFLGLDELKRLRGLAKEHGFALSHHGTRPRMQDLQHASMREIDALVREYAYTEDCLLLTADKVQHEVALAKGVHVRFFSPSMAGARKLKFERFFDETTMSVHLRENVEPYAKKGKPGQWEFVALRKGALKREEIQEMSREIIEEAKIRMDGFIEIERKGSTIVQLGMYRIVMTKPPFSDGWEITAVRPVKRLRLEDYKITEKLHERIAEQAEGILVAGAPGMGKTTFVQGLAEFYIEQDKIVKTIEAPRDLVLPEKATQYAISYGDAEEVHDVLLLNRPDYTLFDEMRNTKDFELFADLRLAGVGMVGVVHATDPVDAIQRFLGRVEMGVIPQIVDTVIFIKNGQVEEVLALKITVKVPSGMTEADLARPVVEITDFEAGNLKYEIYTFGEQTMVVPVSEEMQAGAHRFASSGIQKELEKYSPNAQVEVMSNNKIIVRVPEGEMSRLIGKQGATIKQIEKELGMSVDVQPLSKEDNGTRAPGAEKRAEVPFEIAHRKNNLLIDLGVKYQYADVDVLVDGEYLFSAKAGKTGLIKTKKDNEHGRRILEALNRDGKIQVLL